MASRLGRSAMALLVVSLALARTEVLYTKALLPTAPGDVVCLDGSPGALYYRPASDAAGARKFYLHFEGGGWCVNLQDCLQRSRTLLGSSRSYPDRMVPYQDRGYFNTSVAYFSSDPVINPQMHNWQSVFLRYCDGTSFTGARHGAVPVPAPTPAHAPDGDGAALHFRGSAILDAAIAFLLTHHALANATDVVVGGASAGGLAVYLHADRWKRALPASVRVTALPDSGFFLQADTAGLHDLARPLGQRDRAPRPGFFETDMRSMVAMANSTPGLPRACVDAHTTPAGTGDVAGCVFAQVAAQHLQTPTFALQSQFDSWQLQNILACPTSCQTANATAVTAYGARVRAALRATFLANPQHGAFLESCEHHCFKWGDIRIDGAVQAGAFAAWYAGGRRVWNQTAAYPCPTCCSAK